MDQLTQQISVVLAGQCSMLELAAPRLALAIGMEVATEDPGLAYEDFGSQLTAAIQSPDSD